MNNNPEQHQIESEVLERIRSGKLRMKPRFFFVLKTALVIAITVLILLISVWLASFISFGLRLSGNDSLLGFGTRGILMFIAVFPWWLALIDLALIALLAWLLRHFKFGYRKPVLYLLGALIVGGVAGGLLFDRETPFHDDRFHEAESGELFAPLESLYEGAHTKAPEDQGIYRGFVVTVAPDSFVLTHDDYDNSPDDGTWTVRPPSGFDIRMVRVGDRVYVGGEKDGNVIEAYGVRILDR
ncbi:MAG TPA: hypothetical protein VN086_03280 [Candidatus Paceibacterota bacterium]|nr:hypothetical protein [Candidatus Paceibacterota bacterium]